ncbi:hypothetical protein Dimus_025073 [Dionaea muscipula]
MDDTFTSIFPDYKCSTMWKDILNLRTHYPQLFQLFSSKIVYKVGDGQSFKFWKDPWIGAVPKAKFLCCGCEHGVCFELQQRILASSSINGSFTDDLLGWQVIDLLMGIPST